MTTALTLNEIFENSYQPTTCQTLSCQEAMVLVEEAFQDMAVLVSDTSATEAGKNLSAFLENMYEYHQDIPTAFSEVFTNVFTSGNAGENAGLNLKILASRGGTQFSPNAEDGAFHHILVLAQPSNRLSTPYAPRFSAWARERHGVTE